MDRLARMLPRLTLLVGSLVLVGSPWLLAGRAAASPRGTVSMGFSGRQDAPQKATQIAIRAVSEDAVSGDKAVSEPGPDPQPDAKTAEPRKSRPADPAHAPPQSHVADAEPPCTLQEPAGSLLLPPEKTAGRSEQLERTARQADRQTRRGFELAGRRAYFAARAEFIRALRLVAQGLDAEHHTTTHSRSLAAALRAIKEAEAFLPDGSRLEADLDIPGIISGHRTPVLRNADTQSLTPMLALKRYFTFAQEQLAAAAGREIAGSMALHALGKLHAAMVGSTSGSVRAAEPKAMTFYQAALLVCPQNYLAANDLGVLLARCGNYHQARAALVHSLTIHRQPAGWHNLAVVYRQLGQSELARRADQQSAAARKAEMARRKARQGPRRQLVRWVDPKLFARTQTRSDNFWQATPAGPKPTNTASFSPPAPPEKTAITGWWPRGAQTKRK